MSELNINLNKTIATEAPKSASTTAAVSASSSQAIPIVSKPSIDEILKKLGITKEQYNELIIKHPGFDTLSREEQIKIIAAKSAAPETVAVGTKVETKQAEIVNANETEKTVHSEHNHDEIHSASGGSTFDKAVFNELNLNKKGEVIAYELAKNKFLYGDSKNPKTEEDWNKLTDEERNAIVKPILEAEKSHKGEFAKIFGRKGQHSVADSLMSEIQAANRLGMSADEFKKLSAEQKEEVLYDYLNELNETDKFENRKSSFSNSDKDFWDKTNLLAESTNYYFKTVKGEERNICPGEVSGILKSEKLNIEKVQLDYLKNKSESGEELSEYEKTQLNYLKGLDLKSVKQDKLAEIANNEEIKPNEPPSLYAEIQNSEYADEYNSAIPTNKADVLNKILLKKHGGNTKDYHDAVMACALDARRAGDLALAQDLATKAVKFAGKHAIEVSEPPVATELLLINRAIPELDSESAAIYAGNIEKNIKNSKLRTATAQSLQLNSKEEQRAAIARVHILSQDEETQIGVVDNLRNSSKKSETQNEVDKVIRENGTVNVRKHAVKTTGELNKDVQLSSLQRQLEDKIPELVETAAEVPSTLHKDNQTPAFKHIRTVAQDLSPEVTKRVEMTLADQIAKSHKDNQLDMHNDIMQSKYDEVLERAASNINQYDKSVQADAIKSTYATGNEKAIEACNLQIDKCQGDLSSVQNEINANVAKMEAKYAEKVAETVAGTLVNISKAQDVSMTDNSQQENKKQLINNFMKADSAERYKMISKLPSNIKSDVYLMMCKYCPKLLSSDMIGDIVQMGYGRTILRTDGVSPSIKFELVHKMLSSDSSNKKIASNYVFENEAIFADATRDKALAVIQNTKIDTFENKYTSKPEQLGGNNNEEIKKFKQGFLNTLG
ncbi:unknown [Clostridium sp. CAG:967]|nr:unknown [Clostridium sp. CAG:967]